MSLKLGLRNKIRRGRAGGFTPLLNQSFASGATAAYSLRRLKSTATKAVRVREDSGNTETDIGFSGALLDETALLNHCGSANGFVTKWYDQSGNGNDASNSTASQQPKIVDSGSVITENGKSAIQFDGSSTVLIANTNNITYSALSWFVIFSIDYNSSKDNGRALSQTLNSNKDNKLSNNLIPIFRNSTNNELATFSETVGVLNSYSPPANTQILNSVIGNSSVPFVRDFLDNAKVDEELNTTFGTTINKIFVGSNLNREGIAGKFSEAILYYSDKLSERNSIETNINNFYSIF